MDPEQACGFGIKANAETVAGLMNLEQEAYNYNISGKVCGMEVADFEQLMLAAAAHIERLGGNLSEALQEAEKQAATAEWLRGEARRYKDIKAELATVKRERDAAVRDFKKSIETDHCQFCTHNERCERRAERNGEAYAVPEKGCGFRWRGVAKKKAR